MERSAERSRTFREKTERFCPATAMYAAMQDRPITRRGDIRFGRSWRRLKAENEGFQTTPRSCKTETTMTRYESIKTNPEIRNNAESISLLEDQEAGQEAQEAGVNDARECFFPTTRLPGIVLVSV